MLSPSVSQPFVLRLSKETGWLTQGRLVEASLFLPSPLRGEGIVSLPT